MIATRSDVEMRLAADAVQLPVVRAVAVNVAMRADFDLDAISDLGLAVDEACSSLILLAHPQAQLTCRFRLGPDELVFRASVPSEQGLPSTRTFGWRVLRTLTDHVDTWVDSAGVHLELTKCRPTRVSGQKAVQS